MSVARPLCLVGLRCVGKSTVGALLARRLGCRLLDLDQELAAAWARRDGGAQSPPAGELLARLGQPAFRDLELQTLELCLAEPGPLVIATGGGCVERGEARQLLKTRARTLWLVADPALLARRLQADDTERPSLTGGDPAAELAQLALQRAPLYEEVSEASFDASLPAEQVAAAILAHLGAGV